MGKGLLKKLFGKKTKSVDVVIKGKDAKPENWTHLLTNDDWAELEGNPNLYHIYEEIYRKKIEASANKENKENKTDKRLR